MSEDLVTVRVMGSQALGKPDGAAIRLILSTGQSIAFEVDQRAIDALRRDLTAAENLLKRLKKPGRA